MKSPSIYTKHLFIFASVLGIITIFLPILPLTSEIFKGAALFWACSVAIFSRIFLFILYTSFLVFYALLYRKFYKETNHSVVYFVVSSLVLSILVVGPIAGILFDMTFFMIPRTSEQQALGAALSFFPVAAIPFLIPISMALGYSIIASIVGIAVGFRMRMQLGYQTPQPIFSDSIPSPSALTINSHVVKLLRDPLTLIITGLFVIPLFMRIFGIEMVNTLNGKVSLNKVWYILSLIETFVLIAGIILFFKRRRLSDVKKTEKESNSENLVTTCKENSSIRAKSLIVRIGAIVIGFMLSFTIIILFFIIEVLIKICAKNLLGKNDIAVAGFLSLGIASLVWFKYKEKFPNAAKGLLTGLLLFAVFLALVVLASLF